MTSGRDSSKLTKLAIMNLYFLKNFLASKVPSHKLPTRISGFTLPELLVTIIISSIIISFVTGIMVDILSANQEEKARNATQQDMKRALDYIKTDLKEASYVYTGEQIRQQRDQGDNTIGSLASHLDVNSDYTIVLAFWKPETIPYTSGGADVPRNCSSSKISSDTSTEECQTLQIERRTYTLVVYLQQADPGSPWTGKSVIRRYQLRKYSTKEEDTYTSDGQKYLKLKPKKGYLDPRKKADSFRYWPYDSQGNNLQDNKPKVNGNFSKVLVDFVGSPNPNSDSIAYNDVNNIPTCLENYTRTPADSKSFFACIKKPDIEGEFAQGNQDVFLYLRGNPDGRFGYNIRAGRLQSYTPLPFVESGVLVRGVVDKYLNN